ncbi:hypothetical protein IEO21_08374 [Rhodonia placenta]|uniref:Uncharacterized protein n=1 Tax=Rhodonia placenta TaxID=104341 RepID=A0A8H7NW97_9APHY|nr:hypothetical protein IEO21_08374 [Postia placenta]
MKEKQSLHEMSMTQTLTTKFKPRMSAAFPEHLPYGESPSGGKAARPPTSIKQARELSSPMAGNRAPHEALQRSATYTDPVHIKPEPMEDILVSDSPPPQQALPAIQLSETTMQAVQQLSQSSAVLSLLQKMKVENTVPEPPPLEIPQARNVVQNTYNHSPNPAFRPSSDEFVPQTASHMQREPSQQSAPAPPTAPRSSAYRKYEQARTLNQSSSDRVVESSSQYRQMHDMPPSGPRALSRRLQDSSFDSDVSRGGYRHRESGTDKESARAAYRHQEGRPQQSGTASPSISRPKANTPPQSNSSYTRPAPQRRVSNPTDVFASNAPLANIPRAPSRGAAASPAPTSASLARSRPGAVHPDSHALNRELWDVRRQLTALHAREEAIAQKLRQLGALPQSDASVPSAKELPRELGALEDELIATRAQLQRESEARQVAEATLEGERLRRVYTEGVLDDARRECTKPFIVPSLLDAFKQLAQLTEDALMGTGTVGSGW